MRETSLDRHAARETLADPSFDVPFVAAWRGGVVESAHRGRFVFCDARSEELEAGGDPDALIFFRSSAKPFQALPLASTGAADAFGLTREELAVACASHNAEPRHLALVRSILRKAGLSEDDLQCGAHPPLYPPAAKRLSSGGVSPRPIHSNCSGKHAGMLALSVHAGWEPARYLDSDGPLQRLILTTLSEICGVEPGEVEVATDGCGVPTFALPLRNLAMGFARLATGEELTAEMVAAAERVREAMRAYPFVVAGTGRLDTRLMESSDLIAKSGAEAVFAAGSPAGWGFALKVSDGARRAVAPAATFLLERRGAPVSAEVSPVENLHGEVVGKVTPLL